MSEDCEALEAFAEAVAGVPLGVPTLQWGEPVPVHVLTHEREWVTGTVTRYSPPDIPVGTLALRVDVKMEGGTSGGPVVDGAGRLIGIVSHSPDAPASGGYDGRVPLPWLALPRWLTDRVAAAGGKRVAPRKQSRRKQKL